MDDIDKVVDDRLAKDADFQTKIATLSDEEKATQTGTRRKEILHEEVGKINQIAKDQKIRAEKAEAEVEKLKPKPAAAAASTAADDQLSTTDMYILSSRQVHPDDLAEVQKAAKLLGKTIAETLDDTTFAPILASRVEKRKVANGTNTGSGRPGATGNTDAELMDNFKKGVVPAAGTPEAERLYKLRAEARKIGKR